jgi:MOSC domain-containing protein YiiM
MTEHILGTIQKVQIQREPLKQGSPTRYQPAGILQVAGLRITPTGLVGITSDGGELLDVHNSAHPQTRYRGGNALSFGFTGHYDHLRERFGAHLHDGTAGENVIVAGPALTPAELGARLGIRHAGGVIVLESIRWIPPCAAFSQYAAGHQLTGAEQRQALQFLSEGRRGYYAAPSDDAVGVVLRPGDALIVME